MIYREIKARVWEMIVLELSNIIFFPNLTIYRMNNAVLAIRPLENKSW